MSPAIRPGERLGKAMTVAVMLNWIGDPYQGGVLAGALEGANAAGANLLCFVGGQLPRDPTACARHRVFDLITRSDVDGLVLLASTLIQEVGRVGLADYCKRNFSKTPLCAIGANVEGIPSLIPSNARGIRNVMSHLVTQHRRHRIAFVRGPAANEEAEARYAAYLESLEEHALKFDERAVFVGNFTLASGSEAVRHFERIPGTGLHELDAIVASNDSMAVGVLRALQARGAAVPESISVVGFDDVENASLASPPLTTVRQPLARLGRQAVRNVLEWAQLGTRPTHEEIDTELVIRRSCGCTGSSLRFQHSLLPEMSCGFESALIIRRQHILDTLTRAARGSFGVCGKDWQARLLNAFVADLDSDRPAAFRCLLEDLAEKLTARGGDVRPCFDVLDCLRRQMRVTLRNDPTRRDRGEEIFYATQLSISDVVQRGLMRERFVVGLWAGEVSAACNRFTSVRNIAELGRHIESELPGLGIQSHYVATYVDGDVKNAELLVACDRGQSVLSERGRKFDGRALLPTPMLPLLSGGRAFVVLPLSFQTESLGHMLLELTLDHIFSFDAIAEAVAAGIRISRLMSLQG